jgi:putative hydrolase of the HAD superfamily
MISIRPSKIYYLWTSVPKPHREIFEHALKVSGASIAESIMIGDDPSTDILGANQMGMNALLFDHQNQRKKSFGVKTFHDFQELPLKLGGIKIQRNN